MKPDARRRKAGWTFVESMAGSQRILYVPWIMDQHRVEVIGPQKPQAVLHTPHRPVPGVIAAPVGVRARLRGEHVVLAGYALQGYAEPPLARPTAISGGGIEVVETLLHCVLDAGDRLCVGDLVRAQRRSAKRHAWYDKLAASQASARRALSNVVTVELVPVM